MNESRPLTPEDARCITVLTLNQTVRKFSFFLDTNSSPEKCVIVETKRDGNCFLHALALWFTSSYIKEGDKYLLQMRLASKMREYLTNTFQNDLNKLSDLNALSDSPASPKDVNFMIVKYFIRAIGDWLTDKDPEFVSKLHIFGSCQNAQEIKNTIQEYQSLWQEILKNTNDMNQELKKNGAYFPYAPYAAYIVGCNAFPGINTIHILTHENHGQIFFSLRGMKPASAERVFSDSKIMHLYFYPKTQHFDLFLTEKGWDEMVESAEEHLSQNPHLSSHICREGMVGEDEVRGIAVIKNNLEEDNLEKIISFNRENNPLLHDNGYIFVPNAFKRVQIPSNKAIQTIHPEVTEEQKKESAEKQQNAMEEIRKLQKERYLRQQKLNESNTDKLQSEAGSVLNSASTENDRIQLSVQETIDLSKTSNNFLNRIFSVNLDPNPDSNDEDKPSFCKPINKKLNER